MGGNRSSEEVLIAFYPLLDTVCVRRRWYFCKTECRRSSL